MDQEGARLLNPSNALALELDRDLAVADVLLAVLERRLGDRRDRVELHLARQRIGRALHISRTLRHRADRR